MNKKNLCPVLKNYNGDVSKRWYVDFYEGALRKRIFISSKLDAAGRETAAKEIILSLGADQSSLPKWKLNAANWLQENVYVWRKKTYQTHQSKLKIFMERVSSLTAAAVREFFVFLDKKNTHPTTRNAYRQLLRQIDKSVWKTKGYFDFPKVKANKTPAKYFTWAQVKFLTNYFKKENHELYLFVLFQFYCFIRPAELRLLQFGDILLDEQKILIRGEISKNKKEQYVRIPAPFLSVLLETLTASHPSNFIFGGKSPRGINHFALIHRKLLQSQNFDIKRHKLYSWKHSGAVAAVKAGVHIKQLQVQLRHHSLDQVNDYLRQLGVEDLTDLDKFPAI